ncbi:MAG: DUF6449 domain-containing protein [Syntrophomonas sp.]|nr:DUF6449 domain-containing protein [Syntrophomonas sp.]
MKSKTSFINPGILHNDFKSLGWISGIYLLGMLLSVPLKILMLHGNQNMDLANSHIAYLHVFQFNSPLQLMLLVLVPVLTAVLLFRYLQTDKAADMVHALPVQRITIYNTHLLAGLIFLFVPLIITALVSWALVAGLGISSVTVGHILNWLGVGLLINLLLFMTSAATAMITGMSVVQGILSYILLLLPAGLSMLLLHNLQIHLYGFAYSYFSLTNIASLSPLVRFLDLISLRYIPLSTFEIIAYLLTSAALYGLGGYLYRHRQLETAGNAITFAALRPFFKYGVTFCSMLLLGSYFYSTQNTLAWTWFGYLLGALGGYFLIEILYKKSWQVFQFRTMKGLLIYGLIVIGLVGALNADLTGYQKKLPTLNEIESIYLDNSYIRLSQQIKSDPATEPLDINLAAQLERAVRIYTEPDSISKIHSLHQEIIEKSDQGKAYQSDPNHNEYRNENICLAYNLKNGSTVYRQYNIKAVDYEKSLSAIYETEEYKVLHYPIISLNSSMIKMLEIEAANVNKSVRIIDPQLIDQAVAALQADAMSQTYEEMTRSQPAWAEINILLDTPENEDGRKDTLGLSWKKSFVNFEQWLKDTQELNNARIIPGEDIEYAIVARRVEDAKDAMVQTSKERTQQAIVNLANNPDNLKISDPDQLETCLRSYGYDHGRSYDSPETIYDVIFLLKNGSSFTGGFTEDSAPIFVREFFAG